MRNRITYLLACLVVSSGSLAQSIYKDNSYSPAERAEDLVKQLTLEEKVALMMDNSKPVERLGIKPYNWWNEALHGVGRAGNLDMLESMDHLVMISCHIHSKIMARNELAAVPIRPASMDYEYGFLTRADVRLSLEEQALLEKIEGEVQREFEA